MGHAVLRDSQLRCCKLPAVQGAKQYQGDFFLSEKLIVLVNCKVSYCLYVFVFCVVKRYFHLVKSLQ